MSNNEIAIALIGIVGTLAGAILGWWLNFYSYKFGKTKIYATFITSLEIPYYSDAKDNSTVKKRPRHEYYLECVASNSRQIPVILDNFNLKMERDSKSKPLWLSVQEADMSYSEWGKIKVSYRPPLSRQLLPPRTLHEFKFKIDYSEPDIIYSRLTLIAYSENRKPQKFMVYDGRKLERPPQEIPSEHIVE